MFCITYKQITTHEPEQCEYCDELHHDVCRHWVASCPAMHNIREQMKEYLPELTQDAPEIVFLNSQAARNYKELRKMIGMCPP